MRDMCLYLRWLSKVLSITLSTPPDYYSQNRVLQCLSPMQGSYMRNQRSFQNKLPSQHVYRQGYICSQIIVRELVNLRPGHGIDSWLSKKSFLVTRHSFHSSVAIRLMCKWARRSHCSSPGRLSYSPMSRGCLSTEATHVDCWNSPAVYAYTLGVQPFRTRLATMCVSARHRNQGSSSYH